MKILLAISPVRHGSEMIEAVLYGLQHNKTRVLRRRKPAHESSNRDALGYAIVGCASRRFILVTGYFTAQH